MGPWYGGRFGSSLETPRFPLKRLLLKGTQAIQRLDIIGSVLGVVWPASGELYTRLPKIGIWPSTS